LLHSNANEMLLELLLVLAGLYLAWTLGANDATNIVSMAVGSKTISLRKAMIFFILCLGVGVVFLSGNIIETVSSDIVSPRLITMGHATIALLVAASWVHFATWKGWPVSISQSVVSAVMGIGLMESWKAGVLLLHWQKISILAGVWLISPLLGFLGGWLLFKIVHRFVRHRHLYFSDTLRDLVMRPFRTIKEWIAGDLRQRERLFKGGLVLSAGYMAVALGANTVGSTTGLIYSGFRGHDSVLGVSLENGNLLLAMKLMVLVAVVLGMVTFGQHLVDFIGTRLVELNALRGAAIQVTSASVVLVAALMGYPISTTGVFVGAFLGVDSGEDHPRMKKHAAHSLKMAFLVTIPVTAFLAGGLTWVLI
jgi:inorganic phosphate transporter, PiT family